ncbi:MAG: hypothetical protein GXX10_02775 [Clostridiaceae bacterium]|nr:hypothetical protein [Clostridiaceae bacterium]
MKKKTIIIGAVVTCLLAGSVTAFAARESKLLGRDGFDFGKGNLRERIEARREVIKEKLGKIREIRTDMSAYEPYGLTYDEGKDGWYYEGKLVGVFVDKDSKGIVVLSRKGEVHLKALRDENGNLTGLTELTDEEYALISSQLEKMRDDLADLMDEVFENMESRMKNRHEIFESIISGDFEPAEIEEIRDEIRERLRQQREEFKIEREDFRTEQKQRLEELLEMLE